MEEPKPTSTSSSGDQSSADRERGSAISEDQAASPNTSSHQILTADPEEHTHAGAASTSWQFKPEPTGTSSASDLRHSEPPKLPITWSASEFVAHEKTFGWYAVLAIAALILAAIVFFLTHDKISTGVIIVAAIILGVYANRQPRVLEYRLDTIGLSVGEKFYAYDNFKSFSVLDEGAISSIVLAPLKRFSPALSVYYAPEDEDKIIATLADRLPMEDSKSDAVDSFMRRIRF